MKTKKRKVGVGELRILLSRFVSEMRRQRAEARAYTTRGWDPTFNRGVYYGYRFAAQMLRDILDPEHRWRRLDRKYPRSE